MTPQINVFIDLSAAEPSLSCLPEAVARWHRVESLGEIARHVHVLPPPGLPDSELPRVPGWTWSTALSPVEGLNAAIMQSATDKTPLLVLLGSIAVTPDLVGLLQENMARDPMIGWAVARAQSPDGCNLARLTRHGVGPSEWVPQWMLSELPATALMPEMIGSCLLIRVELLADFGLCRQDFEGAGAALLHYLSRARRCGFRTILCNKAMVQPDDCNVVPAPAVSDPDGKMLRELVPDLDRSWHEFRGSSWERYETLCAVHARRTDARPSLLLDLRGVGPVFNGTNQAALGILEGLERLDPRWDIATYSSPETAEFHAFARVHPGWSVFTALPDRPFTAALRLSQPWYMREAVDLHGLALFNAYLMLDTIAWDIVYTASPHLDGTWQFVADYADALLFISDFSERRFVERFAGGGRVPSLVARLACDPQEYVEADVVSGAAEAAGDEFLLVVGNHLDHKDVGNTVDLLSTAFPFRRIVALGATPADSPVVRVHASGDLPNLEMHRLYAGAQAVIFPSFYEGFGLPIVTALAYGRTVLARHSALLDELARHCRPHGRLIAFENRDELIDLIGRLTHGGAVPELPLGGALGGGTPGNWRDVAHQILTFLEPVTRQLPNSRWIAREHVVNQLRAARS